MPPIARRAILGIRLNANGSNLIPVRGECTDIAQWNRLTQDPLFQIIASLRLHNAAGADFNV